MNGLPRTSEPLLDGTMEATLTEQVARLWPGCCGPGRFEPVPPSVAPPADTMPLAEFVQESAARMLAPPGPTVHYVHPDEIRAGLIPDLSLPPTTDLVQALLRAERVASRKHLQFAGPARLTREQCEQMMRSSSVGLPDDWEEQVLAGLPGWTVFGVPVRLVASAVESTPWVHGWRPAP